jgi:hypothetical protein
MTYISPSSLRQYETDKREFYLRYLCETPPPREPQTKPMAIGSAFDARIKALLEHRLLGRAEMERAEFYLAAQVEEYNLSWARMHSLILLDAYIASGALGDLMIELENATEPPHLEMEVRGDVLFSGMNVFVPMLGRPDMWYKTKEQSDGSTPLVVLDWKVNGFCSARAPSPMRGYTRCRTIGGASKMHPDTVIHRQSGVDVNVAHHFESIDTSWADQLGIYDLLLSGSGRSISGIDQLLGSGTSLRVATYRGRVGSEYHRGISQRVVNMWQSVQTLEAFQYVAGFSQDDISMLDSINSAFQNEDSERLRAALL